MAINQDSGVEKIKRFIIALQAACQKFSKKHCSENNRKVRREAWQSGILVKFLAFQ